jgi:multidrug efflux system outer membrane protein
MRTIYYIILLAGGLVFAGCKVGPNYQPPQVAVAKQFAGLNQPINTNPPPSEWWKTFHDPELDRLVDLAMRQNYDLQGAYARLRQSRFQRSFAAADLFPTLLGDGGYEISRGSKNVKLSLGGGGGSGGSGGSGSGSGSSGSSGSPSPAARAQAQAQPQAQSQNSEASSQGSGESDAQMDQLTPLGKGGLPGQTTELYQAGFDASWEIDVFGGKRRSIEAATAAVAAAKEGERDLMVTLLAEVARDYLDLRGTQQRLAIANSNLVAQQNVLELTRSKRKAGLANDLDVTRAAAQAATTAATLPPLQAGVQRLIHSLSILLAEEPNALQNELATNRPLPAVPPGVPVGLPSQLLERRPDIRQAEREIAVANAKIGNATADLFPKFALIASAGLDSSTPQNLFDWESRYFLLSPTVTWRIFDAGRVISNIGLQKAYRQEALFQYRGTILKALQEVEDALVAYATEQSRRSSLVEALNQNRQSVSLAQQQYDHGLTSFIDVLDAQRTSYSAEDQLAQSDEMVTTDLVALYKALGGGWK